MLIKIETASSDDLGISIRTALNIKRINSKNKVFFYRDGVSVAILTYDTEKDIYNRFMEKKRDERNEVIRKATEDI